MSRPSEELELVAGLASLPHDDPERVEAYQRAQADPQLMQGLVEGERLMALLSTWTVPPPSEAVLQRVAASVFAEMDAERARASVPAVAGRPRHRVAGVLIGASLVVAWAAVIGLSSKLLASNPRLLWSAIFLLAALGATAGAFRLGRWVAVGLTAAATGLAAVLGGPGGIGAVSAGAHCLSVTLACAAIPVATTAVLAFKGRLQGLSASAVFAGVAAAGALAGTAALELTCGTRLMGHLLMFHAGGIALSALLGAGMAQLPQMQRAFSQHTAS